MTISKIVWAVGIALLSPVAHAGFDWIGDPILPSPNVMSTALDTCLENQVAEATAGYLERIHLAAGPLHDDVLDPDSHHHAGYIFTGVTPSGGIAKLFLRLETGTGEPWTRWIDQNDDHYFLAGHLRVTGQVRDIRRGGEAWPVDLWNCAEYF